MNVPLLASMFLACTAPASDYTLTVVPHFVGANGDALFAKNPVAELVLRYPDGGEEVWDLGVASAGATIEIPNLGPLEAGTAVGLAFEAPGAALTNDWDRSSTLAYGEAVLDDALALGGAQLVLDIVPLWVDRVTRLGKTAANESQLGGAPAITADGTMYVFGGGDWSGFYNFGMGIGSNKVLKVPRTATGWTDGRVLAESLPAQDLGYGMSDHLASAAALAVDTARGERIFVLGGRQSELFSAYNSDRWLEFDPAKDKFTDEGELEVSRSGMLVLPVGASKLLLFGGLGGPGIPLLTSYEFFTPGTGNSTLSTNSDRVLGNYGAFGTSLGSDAAVCAGAFVDALLLTQPLTPVSQCFIITPADAFREISLPVPLFGASMAALPDGGLLVTGGASVPLDRDLADQTHDASTPALSAAWRWSPGPNEWEATANPLIDARAHHVSLALADGRVLIVGGSSRAGHLGADTGEAVTTTEIYDPTLDRFTIVADDATGGGQNPRVSGRPGGPWAVLQGTEATVLYGAATGGAAYGVIGGLP